MKSRENRRYRKALIKKRLIARALRRCNRYKPDARIRSMKELLANPYFSLRALLRNEGKPRTRCYQCGQPDCGWCFDNLVHKNRIRSAAIHADYQAWQEGAYVPTNETIQDGADVALPPMNHVLTVDIRQIAAHRQVERT